MRNQRLFSSGARATLFFVIALFVACAGPATAAATDATAKLSIQARLFQAKSGTLSADVLAPGAPDLVNVVARDDPSTSTLVLVAVALADGSALPSDSRVRLVARERVSRSAGDPHTRTVLDKAVTLGTVSKGGMTHIPFWLPDVGCRSVDLKATLSVARQPVSLSASAVIPFVCSE